MHKITVNNTEISILKDRDEDYISLTDIIKAQEGDFFISDWLRNRNTLEFLSVWEGMYNPDFNYGEFAIIRNQAGLNSFKVSVKDWVEKTKAVGILAKTGRYGGTYAHKDIALGFASWLSPSLHLYIIKEFQRLKEEEYERLNSEWDLRRLIVKVNYKVHTDAIKKHLVPYSGLSKEKERIVYAEEAEILNQALFNQSSKEWRAENSELAKEGYNIRDMADEHELIVLSSLETMNAIMIKYGASPKERFAALRDAAIDHLESLRSGKYSIERIRSPFAKQLTSGSKGNFDRSLKIKAKGPSGIKGKGKDES